MGAKKAIVGAAMLAACSAPGPHAVRVENHEASSPPLGQHAALLESGPDPLPPLPEPTTEPTTTSEAPETTVVRRTTTTAVLVAPVTTTTLTLPEHVDAHLSDGEWSKANGGSLHDRIEGCESYGDPNAPPNYLAENHHSTASGAAQYLDSTWNDYGGYRRAMQAPPSVQEERFTADLARGTGPWESSRSCWG